MLAKPKRKSLNQPLIPFKGCYQFKEDAVPSADERFFSLSGKLEMAYSNRPFHVFCESCPHHGCKNGDPS
ncbi:hypothetical protein WB44_05755 [Synechococcus sp. WH 8020]|nr:hypothetical protein WB44_05755 [Synechococcus sp. WH 8020]